jgi:hypothetical protein
MAGGTNIALTDEPVGVSGNTRPKQDILRSLVHKRDAGVALMQKMQGTVLQRAGNAHSIAVQ